MDKDAERLLAESDSPLAGLAKRLCDRILEIFPDPVVTTDEERIGFGTAPGYKGLVFTVAVYRTHVTLGLAYAAGLPDPAGLMQGSGKVHRHVKIRTEADLDRPELAALLEAALER